MPISTVNKILKFEDRDTLLKTLLYVNLSSKGISLPDNIIYVLSLFTSETSMDKVIKEAMEKKYVNSWQSGDNAVSLLVKTKLLDKIGRKQRRINPDIFPEIPTDTIAATYKIHNI